MKRSKRAFNSTKQSGFSLIEMGVVLAIIASTLGSVITLTNQYQARSKYDVTQEKLEAIDTAIQNYVLATTTLPCPADPDLAEGNAEFAKSTDCSAAAAGGITEVSVDGSDTKDNIRIGVVPTRTLNLPDDYLLDGWNMRIKYAVITDLAIDKDTFESYSKPAISPLIINDSNGNELVDQTTGKDMFTAYIIISHGQDKKGAHVKSGATASTCTAGFGDTENCDNDEVFVDTNIKIDAETDALFFDDLILWKSFYLIEPDNK